MIHPLVLYLRFRICLPGLGALQLGQESGKLILGTICFTFGVLNMHFSCAKYAFQLGTLNKEQKSLPKINFNKGELTIEEKFDMFNFSSKNFLI